MDWWQRRHLTTRQLADPDHLHHRLAGLDTAVRDETMLAILSGLDLTDEASPQSQKLQEVRLGMTGNEQACSQLEGCFLRTAFSTGRKYELCICS